MKKKALKKVNKILQKKCEVLSLLLGFQTFKMESLKEEFRKLERKNDGILQNKH